MHQTSYILKDRSSEIIDYPNSWEQSSYMDIGDWWRNEKRLANNVTELRSTLIPYAFFSLVW